MASPNPEHDRFVLLMQMADEEREQVEYHTQEAKKHMERGIALGAMLKRVLEQDAEKRG